MAAVMRAILLSILLVAPACVTKGTYDAAVQDAAQAKAAHAKDAAEAATRIDRLEKDLEHARLVALENDAALARTTATKDAVQKKLDEQTAMNQKLRAELETLGKDVDALLAEKGTLGASLADAKKRLEELRKAQAAAEARAALYAELVKRFKSMVDAGELAIDLREGRMVLKLPSDVLFDSGKADLKPAGKSALEGVAAILKTVPRRFQVAGHTDDEPIKLSPYASNWELSTARAPRTRRRTGARRTDGSRSRSSRRSASSSRCPVEPVRRLLISSMSIEPARKPWPEPSAK